MIPEHLHILLMEHCVEYSQFPFRFFHAWFELDDLDVVFRDYWSTILVGEALHNP